MTGSSLTRRSAAAVALATLLVGVTGATAYAAWSANASGNGAGLALTMPGGNQPSASVSGDYTITITFAVSRFSTGALVESYTIERRANAQGSPDQTVTATCSAGAREWTCTETNVPAGTWIYAVIPIQGGWHGAESAPSNAVQM